MNDVKKKKNKNPQSEFNPTIPSGIMVNLTDPAACSTRYSLSRVEECRDPMSLEVLALSP